MSALETVTETKWDLYLCGKKWISCVGDVLATFPKLWFDLCAGTCEWIFMSGAELCCTLDSASSHSFQQGPLKNTKLNLLSVHTDLELEYF